MTNSLPSDSLAETIVLSSCISSIDALNEVVDVLKPDDFYHGINGSIFSACKERYLKNLEVDAYSIISALGSSITPQSAKEIMDLRDYFDSQVPLAEYIQIIAEKSNLRKIYFSSVTMGKDVIKEGAESNTIVEQYVSTLSDTISGRLRQTETIGEVMENFYKGMDFKEYLSEKMRRVAKGESPYKGVQSHYSKLDETIGSFQDGCLHYIGARTSMGKTTFLMNIMNNILVNEPETVMAFMSLEMLRGTITEKLICMEAGVAFKKMSNGTLNPIEYGRIIEASTQMNGNLIIDDSPMDITMLSARARRLVNVDGAKIIFIDYLTCVKATGKLNSNHERVNQVSKGLLSLAKELNVPVVCLAQLNRAVTTRENKTPTLADFRESGSIEEDADVCMLIHRPQYYDSQNADCTTHIIVAKNRLLGELRTIKYEWDDDRPGNFSELDNIEILLADAVAGYKPEKEKDWRPGNDW